MYCSRVSSATGRGHQPRDLAALPDTILAPLRPRASLRRARLGCAAGTAGGCRVRGGVERPPLRFLALGSPSAPPSVVLGVGLSSHPPPPPSSGSDHYHGRLFP